MTLHRNAGTGLLHLLRQGGFFIGLYGHPSRGTYTQHSDGGLLNRTSLTVVNGLQPSCLIPGTATRQNLPFNHSPKLPEAPPVAINAESEAVATLHSL